MNTYKEIPRNLLELGAVLAQEITMNILLWRTAIKRTQESGQGEEDQVVHPERKHKTSLEVGEESLGGHGGQEK